MKQEITQAYLSNDTVNFNILGKLELELVIKENSLSIPLNSLLGMAARKNKKREFLFVSKVLGKHIPLNPKITIIAGQVLAYLFSKEIDEKVFDNSISVLVKALTDDKCIDETDSILYQPQLEPNEPTLFIGFAETATGLGNAMYSAFCKNAGFIHTTRDILKELKPIFEFKEEHSHATDHVCYAFDNKFFDKFSRIVLVDDEVTTGKTALNLIKALNERFPGKKYVLASLLDWRSDDDIKNFEKLKSEFGIENQSISLIRGNVSCTGSIGDFIEETFTDLKENDISVETIEIPLKETNKFTVVNSLGNEQEGVYPNITGMFGITNEDNDEIRMIISDIANKLKAYRKNEKCLCLGFGEFIYIPAAISAEMGSNVYFHSTTRSPIYPVNRNQYAIKTGICFDNPYDSSVPNFIYNLIPGEHKEVYVFLGRDIEENEKLSLAKKLSFYGIEILRFVVLTKEII